MKDKPGPTDIQKRTQIYVLHDDIERMRLELAKNGMGAELDMAITRTRGLCNDFLKETAYKYDPEFGDDRICKCGHTYYRHFDSYEDMYPIGCKYCECYEFEEEIKNVKKS